MPAPRRVLTPQTWDGLERATDNPHGATVVVRRPGGDGVPEFLVLHRAHHGPGYEGDWAWTAPAGCRHPGEAVYPAALRELAEEAGLSGFVPWAVDLTGPAGHPDAESTWALFAIDVPAGTEITLLDPEHDRFQWSDATTAAAVIRPGWVGERQIAAVARIPAVDLAFRPMVDADFAAVARWQRAEHVAPWWDSLARTAEDARARYGPWLAGQRPVRIWVVEVDGQPVGHIQDYRVSSYPDYAAKSRRPDAVAIDYLIGEPAHVGRGIGTRMIWEFCRDVLCRDYPEVPQFIASPSHRNGRSLRVLEKCGFTRGLWIDSPASPGEPADTEIVCTLDRRHWFG